MRKRKNGVIIAVCCIVLLVIVVIVISLNRLGENGGILGFQQSSVGLTVTYQDGSSDIATEFDFEYNSVKKEVNMLKVELDETTKIAVQDYSGPGECRLIIYQNSEEIWNGMIQDGAIYSELVSQKGIYELALETGEGSGMGTVKLIP